MVEPLEGRAVPASLSGGDLVVTNYAAGPTGSLVQINPGTGAQTVVTQADFLESPRGVVIAPNGDLFVTDITGREVLLVDQTTGVQSVVTSDGSLINPFGIVIDANGDLLVASGKAFDPLGIAGVLRINPTTGAQTVVTSGGLFFNPQGLVIDANGDLIVLDANSPFAGGSGDVIRVNPITGAQTLISTGGSFVNAHGIALDANGDILVTDRQNPGPSGLIIRVNPITGAQTILSNGGLFDDIYGIAIAANGDIYVANSDQIIRVDPNTGAQTLVSSGGSLTSLVLIAIVPNHAPSLSGNATLAAVDEDTSNPPGETTGILFSGQFSDANSGDALGGVAVVGNTANSSTEGSWEYSTDGTNWFAIAAVADGSTALALSASTKLRFVPVTNFNGTPPSLTVRAVDSTYSGGYTSGSSRVTVNTSTNGGSSPIAGSTNAIGTSINPVNDAPVLSGANNFTGISEDYTTNDGNLVSSLVPGQISDVDASALQGIAVVGLDSGNGTWEYSTNNGGSWLAFGSLSDSSATVLDVSSNDRIRFVPNSQNGTSASITVRAWDQTDDRASGDTGVNASTNGGTTAFSSATASASVTVSSVNDAPSISGTMTLSTISTTDTNIPGNTVASILASNSGDHASDVDTGAAQGIAVTATDSTYGFWQFSLNGGSTWSALVSASASNALLLAADASTRVRFVPNVLVCGTSRITFRAWDRTSGSNGGTADTTTSGGTTAFSTATAFADIAVNAPPSLGGVPISATINEGQQLAFTATASDSDVPAQTLSFSLLGAPTGASINSSTGAFTWAATEAQGPDTYLFLVRVSDGFASTDAMLTAFVREVNSAPTSSGVPASATLVTRNTLSFTALASDSDEVYGLGNTLTFSLVGAPAGASIDPDTGVFTWTPNEDFTLGTYNFSVRVTDDGVPSRSDTQAITVTVTAAALVSGDLVVRGSSLGDIIAINTSSDPTKVEVVINGESQGLFDLLPITGSIVVNGFGGSDKITVASTVTKNAQLFGGTGGDTLTGGGGDDTLAGESGNDSLVGGVGNDAYLFSNGWGSDSVVESASAGNDRFDFSAATLPVTFTKGATLTAASGVNLATHPGANVESIVGGSSADTFINATSLTVSTWTVSALNAGTLNSTFGFGGIENLTGNSGADTFNLANGVGVTGIINGGSGSNTLSFAGYTSSVTVDLQARTATNIGSFSGSASVKGGSGTDTLVGANVATTWSITGNNTGKSGVTGFSSFENLTGGSANDTFVFSAAKSVSGAIDGGTGVNKLDYALYTTAVKVNLALGTATGIASGISNIHSVTSGTANDILVGNVSNNVFIGGSGRDLIIGALGADLLNGGAGDDILIGGSTDYDTDPAALDALMAEWARTDLAYSARIAHLTGSAGGGLNGPTLLNPITVHDDSAADTLAGGTELDWFLTNLGDLLTDRSTSETQTM